MSVAAIQQNLSVGSDPGARSEIERREALTRAAEQFESILLMQLTSALNRIGGSEAGEDSLFGQDGGSDLAQKMFSEQLAQAMAQAGGVGLKDLILKQFGINPDASNTGGESATASLSKAMSAFREIKAANSAAENFPEKVSIDKSGRIIPVTENYAPLKPGEAQVISTDNAADSNTAALVDDEAWRAAFTNEPKKSGLHVPQAVMNEILSYGTKSAAPLPAAAVTPANSAGFEMPVEGGRISSNFGERFHPVDKRMKFHGGLDIAARRGTPISAASDGTVIFAGRRGGYGNLVIIDHGNGTTTRYAHADRLLVEKGERVGSGQQIATVGSTGKSTGPHLHFEVRENDRAIDPLKLFSNVLPKNSDR